MADEASLHVALLNDSDISRAARYREIARQLRCLAFNRLPFDLTRHDQLLALSKGFHRFPDRLEHIDEKIAAD